MDASTLESEIKALEMSLGSIESGANIWTALVVIGVAMELIAITWELWEEFHERRASDLIPPTRPNLWLYGTSFIGCFLVVGGVWGELNSSRKAGSIQSQLQEKSHLLAGLLQGQVAKANSDAETARKDAENAKLELFNLQQSLSERRLGKAGQERLISRLSGSGLTFADITVLEFNPSDTEQANLAAEIRGALKRLNYHLPQVPSSVGFLTSRVGGHPHLTFHQGLLPYTQHPMRTLKL